jgi:hypothetical protein
LSALFRYYANDAPSKISAVRLILRVSNNAKTASENRAVQARISDAYSVQRNDILTDDKPRDVGFELEASLTPMASAAERKRAWNLNFACLVQNQGCGEICDVMPDAWRDFYSGRGHFDVEKYGPAYLFCKNPPP